MDRGFTCALEDFLTYPSLPELMQGAGVGVLTILISFAIGIFVHHLGDGERKGNYLDLHVALDYVWLFVPSLFVVGVMVTAPFFMSLGSLDFKTLVFIIWLATFLLLFWILMRLYRWVKGDKDDFRLKYLGDFPKSPRDTSMSWKDFWKTEQSSDSRFTEKDFFVTFSNKIDFILQSEDRDEWKLLPRLLDDFHRNIDKRNKTFILVFPEFFPKVLDWNLSLWRRQYSRFAKNVPDRETVIDIQVFEAERIVSEVIKYVTKEALAGRSGNSFSYFKSLADHVSKHESVQIEGSQHTYTYIEHLPIYSDCLDLIPKSPESYDIWNHYFPVSWKVTRTNLEKHISPRIWLHRFLDWSRSRVWNEKDKWDEELDEVAKELFPSVDPIVWAKILSFVMRPWSGSRIQSIVEKSQNFGYIGRIFTGWSDDVEVNFSRQHKEQLENTIDLAVFIFGGILTINNLDQWLSELEKLEYEKGSDLDRRKEHWKEIFAAIRENRNRK